MAIKKNIINDSELKKEFDVILPVEIITTSIDERAKKIQQRYKLDGFRPGKVPLDLIKKREKEELFYRGIEELINDTANDIAEEYAYELALRPKVDIKVMDEDKDVNFTVIFELMPEMPIMNLDEIKVDEYNVVVEDKNIDESIEKILKDHKKWTKKEAEAKLNDSVRINFLGKIDGEEFNGGKCDDYQLELGSHSFIDTFEDQLVGKKEGDEVIVNVVFPDNYHKTSLAGKPAVFEVKVLEVLEPEDAVLDDNFAKTNFNVDNVEEFKKIVKKELENTFSKLSKENLKSKIVKEIENLQFPIPEGILEERFRGLKTNKEKENLRKDITEEINEDELKKEAEKVSRVGLMLSKIAQKEKIEVTDNEITEQIMKSAMAMPGYEKMVVDFYRKNRQALESIKNQILEEKILDYIAEKASKNEIQISVEDFEKIINKL